VADYLSANRCAGRYLLTVADYIAALGVVAVVASFEMGYTVGFSFMWWGFMIVPIHFVIPLSGWIIYRFRQTRALTLAQFFGIRYSHRFRIFAGSLCFIAGIINFGIFPGIAARFFVYFLQLPPATMMMGFEIPTFVIIMAVLIVLALFLAIWGGQIAVLVTDFLQGGLTLVVFLVIVAVFLMKFDWGMILDTLATTAPKGQSLLNPFDTSEVKSFNIWFYLVMAFGMFYNHMGWQASQGYNSAALSPHEARMGRILSIWRNNAPAALVAFVPVCAYVAMNNPAFSSLAVDVNTIVGGIENTHIQSQMTPLMVLGKIVPLGLPGAFCAVMFCAFLTTHDSNLHSWGSILVQDVIVPLRKKPLTNKQHLWMLRLSISGVAVFIFIWSCLFELKDYINMYMFITMAIFLGGAGAVIIGGLYWKRGTTAAAYSAMIVGSVMAVSGIILKSIYPDFLHGMWMNCISMLSGAITYILVSLLGPRTSFNMDQLLHRGKYEIEADKVQATQESLPRWKKIVGITKEFTKMDMIPYIASIGIMFTHWIGFSVVSIVYLIIKNNAGFHANLYWLRVWQVLIYHWFILGIVATIWIVFGGIKDLKKLFKRLDAAKRSDLDDGRVVGHHSLADEQELSDVLED